MTPSSGCTKLTTGDSCNGSPNGVDGGGGSKGGGSGGGMSGGDIALIVIGCLIVVGLGAFFAMRGNDQPDESEMYLHGTKDGGEGYQPPSEHSNNL